MFINFFNNYLFFTSIETICKDIKFINKKSNINFFNILNFYKKININSYISYFYLNNKLTIYNNSKIINTLKLSTKKYSYNNYNSKKLVINTNYAILPYTKKDLEFYISSYPEDYSCLEDVINSEFTKYYKPLYSNSFANRFKEIFNLLRNKERRNFFDSFRIAFSLMYNYSINPIVVSACKDESEFNDYLNCINENKNLDIYFSRFKIIYNITPISK